MKTLMYQNIGNLPSMFKKHRLSMFIPVMQLILLPAGHVCALVSYYQFTNTVRVNVRIIVNFNLPGILNRNLSPTEWIRRFLSRYTLDKK